MADTIKVLAQLNPNATTLTDLYTVGAGVSAVVSSIVVCNQAATAGTFRISVAVAGAADNIKQYIYYDIAIPAKDTFIATIGLSLATTDKIRVYASSASFSFSAYGVEVS